MEARSPWAVRLALSPSQVPSRPPSMSGASGRLALWFTFHRGTCQPLEPPLWMDNGFPLVLGIITTTPENSEFCVNVKSLLL